MSTPARTTGVAVVGCGYWGRNHVRNYAEIGALAAIVDADAAKAAEMAAKHGAPALTFEEALRDPAIGAMAFALPPSQNHALGCAALAAGKHLFVEKPIALDIAEAEDLCARAERAGLTLMVGHILQYHPAFRRLEEMVRAGALGEIRTIQSSRLNFGLIRREEDAWWALAPHDISMILALAGREPEAVTAKAGARLQRGLADLVHAEISFGADLRAHVSASWLNPFKEQKLTIVGTNAMAVFDDTLPWEHKLLLTRYGLDPDGPSLTREEPEWIALVPAEPLREECLHFIDSFRTGATPRTDGREALRVLKVLDAASRSMTALS